MQRIFILTFGPFYLDKDIENGSDSAVCTKIGRRPSVLLDIIRILRADDLWNKKGGGIQSCVCVGRAVITQHRVRCLKIFFSISTKSCRTSFFFLIFWPG